MYCVCVDCITSDWPTQRDEVAQISTTFLKITTGGKHDYQYHTVLQFSSKTKCNAAKGWDNIDCTLFKKMCITVQITLHRKDFVTFYKPL